MVARISVLAAAALSMVAIPVTAADVAVMQTDKKFSARVVEIRVGDRITFVNADRTNHNLYSETDGFEFDLGNQRPGEAASMAFDRAGIIEVKCAIHPKMKLRVRVAP